MTEVYVEHPAGWVGIPEGIPSDRWPSTRAWAAELVGSLQADLGAPGDGAADALRDYLEIVADSRVEREASRVYVWVESWTGPVYVADLVVEPREASAEASLEELAGKGDPEAVEEPVLEPFVTDTGLTGISSVRYFNTDGAGALIARQDYVWITSTDTVRLYTAQFDLVAFERSKPRLAALARTVREVVAA